jgi:tetratricopeptide (TPR) repeat protein
MGRAPSERVAPAAAREVCERIGATVVLEGSIVSLGRDYVVGLRAIHCSSGNLLDVEQASAASKEQVLDAVSQVASRFRRRVGESLRMRQLHDKPLEEATTSSLDALKAFSAGHRATLTESMVAGISLQRRAIELDPNFALAWAHLALSYADSGQTGPAVYAARQAYGLRSRVSDREQFLIDVTYHRTVTGNLEKARQACAMWAQAYPRDALPHALMSGMILQGLGEFETSIEEAKKALALDPDLGPAYTNLAYSYFLEERPKEASQVADKASARGFDPPELLLLRYAFAFSSGDADGMKRAAASAEGRPWAEDWMAQAEALAAADEGRIRVARELARKAMNLAVRSGQPDRAAGYQSAFAVDEAIFGFRENATRQARTALKASHGRDVVYTAALAMGLAGDVNAMAALKTELAARFPEDTTVNRIYLPVLEGLIAMRKNNAHEAADDLHGEIPGELAMVGDGSAMLGNVHSTYVRGEMLLHSGHALEAVAEFQKLLDHPGVRFTDPIGSVAYLEIGRAYHLVGNRLKERMAYETFLRRWRLADPDVPILEAAQTEYRTLK